MILHSKHYPGPGEPVVILHGLYGNQGNWAPQARLLAQDYNVYVFDARNHGLSAWADSMLMSEMAADVAETMQALGLASAHIVGHSMGGKTAMWLALTQPEKVRSLVVVDIAPIAYRKESDAVLTALQALPLREVQSRSDADNMLSQTLPNKSVRDFLLTNLLRSDDGSWRWRFNLPVLAQYFDQIVDWPEGLGTYSGRTLFIKGERSNYILPEHQTHALAQFPQAQLKVVQGAGHWVHSEKLEVVVRLIRTFLHG